jgi:hypothetical protein
MPSICQNDAPRASTATGTGPPDNNMLSKFWERWSLRMPSYPLQCTIREIMPPVPSQQSLPPLGRRELLFIPETDCGALSKRTFALSTGKFPPRCTSSLNISPIRGPPSNEAANRRRGGTSAKTRPRQTTLLAALLRREGLYQVGRGASITQIAATRLTSLLFFLPSPSECGIAPK